MQDWKLFVPFISLIIMIPLVFGLAYLLWETNPAMAIAIVFIGILSLLLEGRRVLNLTNASDSKPKNNILRRDFR